MLFLSNVLRSFGNSQPCVYHLTRLRLAWICVRVHLVYFNKFYAEMDFKSTEFLVKVNKEYAFTLTILRPVLLTQALERSKSNHSVTIRLCSYIK